MPTLQEIQNRSFEQDIRTDTEKLQEALDREKYTQFSINPENVEFEKQRVDVLKRLLLEITIFISGNKTSERLFIS